MTPIRRGNGPYPLESNSKLGTNVHRLSTKCLVIFGGFTAAVYLTGLIISPFYRAHQSYHDLALPFGSYPPMSAPQPNARTQSTGHLPPVISTPTAPLGAVQTMISLLPSLAHSQGAPDAHPVAESPPEISSGTSVPASEPRAHAPSTQTAADVAVPTPAASVSSHGGRPHSRLHGTVHATHSTSALPELAYIEPAPIPIFGGPDGKVFRRSSAHRADNETVVPGHNRGHPEKEKCKVRMHSLITTPVFTDSPAAVSLHSASSLSACDCNRRLRQPRLSAQS